ncbi:AgmX/PglI C-terminal domain-containing protein [candidate division KSB1 bacterium]|nr:AgmX/PglI C-terminal domain-containing protein [candidate division KSB1 bacterium]
MSESHSKHIPMSHHIFSNSYPMIDHFPKELRRKWYESIDYRFLFILLVTSLTVVSLMYRFGNKEILDTLLESRIHSQENYTRFILEDMAAISEQSAKPVADAMSEDRTRMELLLPDNVKVESAAEPAELLQKNMPARAVVTNRAKPTTGVSSGASDEFQTTLSDAPTVALGDPGAYGRTQRVASTEISGPRTIGSPEIEDMKTQRYVEYNKNSNKLIIEEYTPYSSAHEPTTGDNDAAWRDMRADLAKDLNMRAYDGTVRSPEAISRVLLNHNKAIQDCYKQALRENSSLKGKISVQFAVDFRGLVKRVDIVHSSLNDKRLERCILTMIRSWDDFGPSDPNSGDSIYKQTYVFGK